MHLITVDVAFIAPYKFTYLLTSSSCSTNSTDHRYALW